MSAACIRDRLCMMVFQGYLSLLEKTVTMEFQLWEQGPQQGQVSRTHIHPRQYSGLIGFWHEDSYMMNLVLKEWRGFCGGAAGLQGRKLPETAVVVTADKRGDYIEAMLSRYGARALRLGDGMRLKEGMRVLSETAAQKDTAVAVALDGPLGPRHEPKKLAFFLAKESGKCVTGIHMHYNRKLRLYRRWDRYVIPLPFSKVTVLIHDFGPMTAERMKDFKTVKHQVRSVLEQ